MRQNLSIQIKAALLLIVFSMNTVIGFTCAIGVDMGFNKLHHDERETGETSVYVHTDGKKHQHHEQTVMHQHDSKSDSEKGGCCSDDVIKFQQLDKSLAQNANIAGSAPAFVAILSCFFYIDILHHLHVSNQKQISQFFHPPPPDIRILNQRFQI